MLLLRCQEIDFPASSGLLSKPAMLHAFRQEQKNAKNAWRINGRGLCYEEGVSCHGIVANRVGSYFRQEAELGLVGGRMRVGGKL
jgi:hypothetical protein